MENYKTIFRPILFSTPMVQAILEGRKTMTRRTKGLEQVNENPNYWSFHNVSTDETRTFFHFRKTEEEKIKQIFGTSNFKIGDVLWVRENYYTASNWDHWKPSALKSVNVDVFYVADLPNYDIPRPLSRGKIRPCIFLPKEYARIFLKVKAIRVERLHDISEEDAKNEGVQLMVNHLLKLQFVLGNKNSTLSFLGNNKKTWSSFEIWKAHWAELWCKINGRSSWDSNPFVWVYEFERIEKPLDFK